MLPVKMLPAKESSDDNLKWKKQRNPQNLGFGRTAACSRGFEHTAVGPAGLGESPERRQLRWHRPAQLIVLESVVVVLHFLVLVLVVDPVDHSSAGLAIVEPGVVASGGAALLVLASDRGGQPPA